MAIRPAQIVDAVLISIPFFGYLLFGWSPNTVLIALILSIVLDAVLSSTWSIISLIWWHRQHHTSIFNVITESYLAVSGNVIAAAILGGLFLLPAVAVQDPYLMNTTTYDAHFFATLFQVQSFTDPIGYLSLIVVAVAPVRVWVSDLRTRTYQTGNTRILQYEWQNHSLADTTALSKLVVAFLIGAVLYSVAFSGGSLSLMLIVIFGWRVTLNIFSWRKPT